MLLRRALEACSFGSAGDGGQVGRGEKRRELLRRNGVDDTPLRLRFGPVGQLRGAASLSYDLLPKQVALSSNGAHALVVLGDVSDTIPQLVDVPLDGSDTSVLVTGVTAGDW